MATGRRFKVTNGLDNNSNSIENIGASGAHLTRAGAHTLTLTTTDTTNATLPSGTVTLAKVSGETMTNLTLSGTLTAGGGAGTSGQVLTSTGTGVQWSTPAATGVTGSGTTDTIAYWVDSDTLGALATATYPSLTELSYVKGVTSAIQTQLDGKVDENSAITGATKTKITYDAKGLVTAGADATTADISDSSNKRYVTDADLTKLSNLSGTNTGDQNLFSTIAVSGQSNVVADSTSDTLTLVAGSNVSITTNATSDEVTISATVPVNGSGTTDQITYWVDSDTLGALSTATYPSLTELSYVKGVTSAIQTQLNAKASDADVVKLTGDQTIAGVKTFSNNVIVTGDLTVNGTTTNINTTNLVVEDKNIVLGDVTSPTNTTADGGGITLKGTADKTFNWVNATSSWTSSEHIDLASGKQYKINGTQISASNLSNGTTGTGKVVLDDSPTLIGATIEGAIFVQSADFGSSQIEDGSITTTSTTTSNTNIFGTGLRGAEILVQSGDGTNYQVTKLLAVHDGTTVYLTEYGTVLSGSAVASYDMDISGGFVRLKITAASSTSTIHRWHWTALDA